MDPEYRLQENDRTLVSLNLRWRHLTVYIQFVCIIIIYNSLKLLFYFRRIPWRPTGGLKDLVYQKVTKDLV